MHIYTYVFLVNPLQGFNRLRVVGAGIVKKSNGWVDFTLVDKMAQVLIGEDIAVHSSNIVAIVKTDTEF